MNFQFKRGDKLILELIKSDEILEGEYIDGSKDRLVLINISSHKNDYLIKAPYTYYRSEISSVRILDRLKDDAKQKLETVESNSSDFILIRKLEYERLKAMTRNYIYMTNIDSRYFDAVDQMKKYGIIGLAGITTSNDIFADLSLLSISTRDQVYIFDCFTLNMQKFPEELKKVLECDHVEKVLHDSRLLTEILAKRFDVQLTNIFDTKYSDVYVRKKKGELPQSIRSLSECLVHYFNFPATLMVPEDKQLEKWNKRPLSDLRKFKAAQIVTYLLMVRDHLHYAMLENVYKGMNEYSRSLHSCCMTKISGKLSDNKLCDVLHNISL